MEQIPHGQRGGEDLAQDGGQGRAHHAPVEAVDEQGIQHDVHGCAGEGAGHGELRTAVRADDGIQRLTEHVEGHADGDPGEVFLRLNEGLLVDAAAEHGQDAALEDQIDGGEHRAADDADDHGVADAAVRVVLAVCAQADADEGAAAVADHHRDGQCHHGQREHHGVGCVAVGAKVARVCNEDLVDDVVERSHQQRNDAGNRIPAHQHADGLGLQKAVGFLFHKISS